MRILQVAKVVMGIEILDEVVRGRRQLAKPISIYRLCEKTVRRCNHWIAHGGESVDAHWWWE
jgi:hypothetical protein